ncbi:uncharacterized protein LOC128183152 [Crassostrea angulata]|uniref:uncharacterized protein LOC128183152 n=1 Tax=Magallana angulata TaxID=2784310 RepID=UPI0022B0A376|nr:uncharacterized protein LOC128183152 [Crassostrea angulata]
MFANCSNNNVFSLKGEDSGVYDVNSSCDLSTSFNSSESRIPDEIRLRINSRERQRMHELNDALEALRSVLPQSQRSSLKKLSKLSTLVHAREHILSLSRSVEEMKRLVQSMSRETVHDIDNLKKNVPHFVHAPKAFAPVGQRYAPCTSTPIKSTGHREMRLLTQDTLSPYLKYNQFKPNESQMNVRFTENINDSVGVGSANSYSLLQEDRTNAQFTTVPLDATRRNLPEFHIPTMYQNSSPPKPVLKFSVDSLLGLSEGRESCQNHSISEYVDIMS